MIPQNFSVPAGDEVIITLTMDPNANVVVSGTTVDWRVYEQQYGVPTADVPAIISKSNVSPTGITLLDSPPDTITIELVEADTVGLLRNYYHEATVIDGSGNRVTIACGIMAVTQTENR